MTSRDAWERSREVRRVRSEMKEHVKSGGSLTLLLTLSRHEDLDGVKIEKLIRWIPFVGARKALYTLRDLPIGIRLGELTPDQFQLFTRRVREIELRAITREFQRRD